MKIAFDLGDSFFGNDVFPKNESEVGVLVGSLAGNAIVIAGIVCVLMIVAGGLTYIINAGNSNPQSAAKGSKAATMGVVGFVIVFVSYWIVQGIEILTGVDILGG